MLPLSDKLSKLTSAAGIPVIRAPPHDLQRGVHEERSNTEGNKQWLPVSQTQLGIACVAVGTEVILGSIFSARPHRYCTNRMQVSAKNSLTLGNGKVLGANVTEKYMKSIYFFF